MKWLFWVTDTPLSFSRFLKTHIYLDQARHPTSPKPTAQYQNQLSSLLLSLIGHSRMCKKKKKIMYMHIYKFIYIFMNSYIWLHETHFINMTTVRSNFILKILTTYSESRLCATFPSSRKLTLLPLTPVYKELYSRFDLIILSRTS